MLETDCLPLLGMISNCNSPDIAMLRWIAYIKSLNPVLKHITGKMNPVADMLSRARYFDEEKMMAHGENEDFTDGGYVLATDTENVVDEVLPFKDELYGGRLRDIGMYLSTFSTHSFLSMHCTGTFKAEPVAIIQSYSQFSVLCRSGYFFRFLCM